MVSQLALHHLPDLWKLVAFRRVAALLRPGGHLCLADVVFGEQVEKDHAAFSAVLVEKMPESSRAEMAQHLRQEFSTYDWIMDELLRRAGFTVEESGVEHGFLAHYLCRRL
ncbi:MAG: class I SAM-dependent methyltransferase [Thermoleophilia bacterium]|nr:class I SAM-dependent methyltransferase [Thermoleophilia bacterium]